MLRTAIEGNKGWISFQQLRFSEGQVSLDPRSRGDGRKPVTLSS